MTHSTEFEHYEDVRNLFMSYRAAKFILEHPYSDQKLTSLGIDPTQAKEDDKEAERVVRLVDKAIFQLRFAKRGDRLAKILYYRFMSEIPLTTDEILSKLIREGIIRSRTTYFRLLDEAICAACYFLWNEGEVPLIKKIPKPTEQAQKEH